MKLAPDVLADIFHGRFSDWNDQRILASNDSVKIPARRVTVVHRSDGSGTAFNFINDLSKVSPEREDHVGEGSSVKWPTGDGGKGNEASPPASSRSGRHWLRGDVLCPAEQDRLHATEERRRQVHPSQ